MTNQEILDAIKKHNLSIRRIPDKVVGCYDIRHRVDGDEVFTTAGGRQMARHTEIPKHAGWYMVQSVNNTHSTVSWDARRDNLAPTLEESVALFLGRTNLERACHLLGWQGGTIHQVAETTGLTVEQILKSEDIETLLRPFLTNEVPA